jgi:hypothetical protein
MHVTWRQGAAPGANVFGPRAFTANSPSLEPDRSGDCPRAASYPLVRHSGRVAGNRLSRLPGTSRWRSELLPGPLLPRAAGNRLRLRADRKKPRGRHSELRRSDDLGWIRTAGSSPRASSGFAAGSGPPLVGRPGHRRRRSSDELQKTAPGPSRGSRRLGRRSAGLARGRKWACGTKRHRGLRRRRFGTRRFRVAEPLSTSWRSRPSGREWFGARRPRWDVERQWDGNARSEARGGRARCWGRVRCHRSLRRSTAPIICKTWWRRQREQDDRGRTPARWRRRPRSCS